MLSCQPASPASSITPTASRNSGGHRPLWQSSRAFLSRTPSKASCSSQRAACDTHALTDAAAHRLAAHTENPADFPLRLPAAPQCAPAASWIVQLPCDIYDDLYHVLHGRRQILDVIQPSILRWRPSWLSERPWRNSVRWTALLCARRPAV